MTKSIIIVSGLGNAVGTGASVARLFSSKLGYRVALVARPRKDVNDLRQSINDNGGEAEVFAVDTYDYKSIVDVFDRVKRKWGHDSRLKTAVWNTSQWSMIPFLDIKGTFVCQPTGTVDINIVSATAFAQEAVKWFLAPTRGGEEQGGTLIMTGATSALRGAHSFGAFAAGKHGLRALSQAVAREFGPQGVHVAFVIVDGTITTKTTRRMFADKQGKGWMDDSKQVLHPDSIAKLYLYLHEQDPGAWTLECDLRPSKEKF